MLRRLTAALFTALCALLVTASAHADALVQVKVRGAGADGTVTLTALEGGRTFTCRTADHECRIDGVPGGRYRVEFRPSEGGAGHPTNAMIPPSGTVTLFVSAADRD